MSCMTKLDRVRKSLDRLELGKYSEFSIHECCDYIGWIAKWHKVPEDVWRPLCDQATRILQYSN